MSIEILRRDEDDPLILVSYEEGELWTYPSNSTPMKSSKDKTKFYLSSIVMLRESDGERWAILSTKAQVHLSKEDFNILDIWFSRR